MSMRKALRMLDLVFFTVCAIIVLDTVAASAAMGVQSITWWLISMVLFFVPYGLVSAELGSAWAEEGGIYVWVREAMGPFWGTMTSWLYWINVAYWMPSVFVLFAGILQSVFWPGLPMWGQAVVALALTWITVAVGILDLNVGKWVPNVGAVIKVAILGFLGAIGIGYGLVHGTANSFAPAEWLPKWSQALAFAPVIVYNYMGFELMSSASGEMVNPQRDVPKAIFLGGLFIAIAYILSTFGILAAIPVDKVNIVTGITDALQVMINEIMGPGFEWLFLLLAGLVLFTFLANMVTWSIGANRVIAATGLDEKVPSLLGHRHPRYNTPDYAYYIMGVVGSVLVIGNYAGSQNVQNVFWTLFALSSIVFLLPYLLMFPAAIILRYRFPDRPRPYRVPGGNAGLWICAVLGEFFIALACVFFFVPPEGTENVLRHEAYLVGGTVISILLGVWIHLRSRAGSRKPVAVPGAAGGVGAAAATASSGGVPAARAEVASARDADEGKPVSRRDGK